MDAVDRIWLRWDFGGKRSGRLHIPADNYPAAWATACGQSLPMKVRNIRLNPETIPDKACVICRRIVEKRIKDGE